MKRIIVILLLIMAVQRIKAAPIPSMYIIATNASGNSAQQCFTITDGTTTVAFTTAFGNLPGTKSTGFLFSNTTPSFGLASFGVWVKKEVCYKIRPCGWVAGDPEFSFKIFSNALVNMGDPKINYDQTTKVFSLSDPGNTSYYQTNCKICLANVSIGPNSAFADGLTESSTYITTYLNLIVDPVANVKLDAASNSYIALNEGFLSTPTTGTFNARCLDGCGNGVPGINYASTDTVYACNTYTWPLNGITYSISGIYLDSTTGAANGDIYELNLTLNSSSSSSASAFACDTYMWAASGQTYTTSGVYHAYYLNASGCLLDSMLNLTINNSNTTSSSATACNSYIWNGTTYTSSGTYTYTTLNAAGCVNTATLNLTINQSTTSTSSATACNSYTWSASGLTYTTSGTYTKTSLNAAGCVNTAILNLTINQSTTTTTTISASNSYTWAVNGVTYTATGTYTYTSLNTSGCTQTSVLILTITSANTTLNLDLFLQGYYIGGSMMTPALMNEGVGNDPTVTDSITVQLYHPTTLNLVASQTTLLHTNGNAVAVFPALSGSYYIAVRHRNSIYTWSSIPVPMTSGIVPWDWKTMASKAYGNNQVQVSSGVWAFYTGDINQDENVDLGDLSLLENDINSFSSGYLNTDINGDGNIDIIDSPLLEGNITDFIYSIYAWDTTSVATVSTTGVSAISYSSVTCGGSISSDGGSAITARGVCWSTSPNPTTANSITLNGIGTGAFTSTITGLLPGTIYYVKAYAINGNGTSYGSQFSFTTLTPALSIGMAFQGGIIAYILQPSDSGYNSSQAHGLIAAPSDQTPAIWGCSGPMIGGTTTYFGTGNANTMQIMSSAYSCSGAAVLCGNLVLGGYNDWYLPSRDELQKLYLNKTAIGGFVNYAYFSSSEHDGSTAWYINFSNGLQSPGYKTIATSVRAVRSF